MRGIATREIAIKRRKAQKIKTVKKRKKKKAKKKRPAKPKMNPSRKHRLDMLRKLRWAYDENITPEYVVTDRSGKNVGDHLLHCRAVQVLRTYKGLGPGQQTLAVYGARKVPLKMVNKSKALIICGGPALAENFYPKLYPLTDNLNDIKVPIFLFGVGGGYRVFKKADMKLTLASRKVLRHIVDHGGAIGIRDGVTSWMLDKYKIEHELIGCPAYYHPNWNKKFNPPKRVKNVLFTTAVIPGNKPLMAHHQKMLMALTRAFPRVTIGYHRGCHGDIRPLKTNGVVNVTRNLALMEKKYKNFDLHVGYRVHAHIFFLSLGKPSFLLPIDMRGLGAARFSNTPFDTLCKNVQPGQIVGRIKKERTDWKSFRPLISRLNEIHGILRKFVAKIPGG